MPVVTISDLLEVLDGMDPNGKVCVLVVGSYTLTETRRVFADGTEVVLEISL